MVLMATALFSVQAGADIIAENPHKNMIYYTYFGQSITTPSGGPWDHIALYAFMWAGPWNGTGYEAIERAKGKLYLFDEPYHGSPAGLSWSSPLAVAEADSSERCWAFEPSVTLHGDEDYFFYGDTPIVNLLGSDHSYGSGYDEGDLYIACNGRYSRFVKEFGEDLSFRLEGNIVPIPSAFILFGSGIVGLIAFARRMKGRHP
jgi:hypothetical protein